MREDQIPERSVMQASNEREARTTKGANCLGADIASPPLRDILIKQSQDSQVQTRQINAALELLSDPVVEKVIEALRNPLIRRYIW